MILCIRLLNHRRLANSAKLRTWFKKNVQKYPLALKSSVAESDHFEAAPALVPAPVFNVQVGSGRLQLNLIANVQETFKLEVFFLFLSPSS